MGSTYRSARLPKKKKEGKKKYLARALSSPACRCRPRVAYVSSSPAGHLRVVVARDRGRFFSRARRRSIFPRGETDRGDVASA
ncbi:hypothetical protein BHE74_00057293, partial [Ensete ventricosum]